MNCKFLALFLVALCCVHFYGVSAAVGPQCLLPQERGPCRAMMVRYRYNAEKNECEEFMFGGCQGNANNFNTMEACHQTCG